jgi:hypothetical protein
MNMILLGILSTLLGFVIAVLSLGMASDVGIRTAIVLVGIAVSFAGIGVLNRAYLKNVIWKR